VANDPFYEGSHDAAFALSAKPLLATKNLQNPRHDLIRESIRGGVHREYFSTSRIHDTDMDVPSQGQARQEVDPTQPWKRMFQSAKDGVAQLCLECGTFRARNATMGELALRFSDLPTPSQHACLLSEMLTELLLTRDAENH
jgi:hypothetical protein